MSCNEIYSILYPEEGKSLNGNDTNDISDNNTTSSKSGLAVGSVVVHHNQTIPFVSRINKDSSSYLFNHS